MSFYICGIEIFQKIEPQRNLIYSTETKGDNAASKYERKCISLFQIRPKRLMFLDVQHIFSDVFIKTWFFRYSTISNFVKEISNLQWNCVSAKKVKAELECRRLIHKGTNNAILQEQTMLYCSTHAGRQNHFLMVKKNYSYTVNFLVKQYL